VRRTGIAIVIAALLTGCAVARNKGSNANAAGIWPDVYPKDESVLGSVYSEPDSPVKLVPPAGIRKENPNRVPLN
jgi:hypothetical protein